MQDVQEKNLFARMRSSKAKGLPTWKEDDGAEAHRGTGVQSLNTSPANRKYGEIIIKQKKMERVV